jgi:hypothetical protein
MCRWCCQRHANKKSFLDSRRVGAYNSSHSEVVSVHDLIEKDVNGESIHRETAPKSSGANDEEMLAISFQRSAVSPKLMANKVERHGNARYRIG